MTNIIDLPIKRKVERNYSQELQDCAKFEILSDRNIDKQLLKKINQLLDFTEVQTGFKGGIGAKVIKQGITFKIEIYKERLK
ncbi:MAG: hypothetical protein ACRC5T_11050 [Cetobacterium sp.]